MSLSKNEIKYLRSLQLKKFRQKYLEFTVEGYKSVNEFMKEDYEAGWYKLEDVYATGEYMEKLLHPFGCKEVTDDDLAKVSAFATSPGVIATVGLIPEYFSSLEDNLEELCLCLDDIRDPGNLGTIIRLADWYGLKHVFCSPACVDAYNPKTVAANMGSLARVRVMVTDLEELIDHSGIMHVYGAVMTGEPHYGINDNQRRILVIGNEANGISDPIRRRLTRLVTIPRLGQAESLNAAMATAILLDQFCGRRAFTG